LGICIDMGVSGFCDHLRVWLSMSVCPCS